MQYLETEVLSDYSARDGTSIVKQIPAPSPFGEPLSSALYHCYLSSSFSICFLLRLLLHTLASIVQHPHKLGIFGCADFCQVFFI